MPSPLDNVTFAHLCIQFASKDAHRPVRLASVNQTFHEAAVRYLAAFQVWKRIIETMQKPSQNSVVWRSIVSSLSTFSSLNGFERLTSLAEKGNLDTKAMEEIINNENKERDGDGGDNGSASITTSKGEKEKNEKKEQRNSKALSMSARFAFYRTQGLLLGSCNSTASSWITEQLLIAGIPVKRNTELTSNFMFRAATTGNLRILRMLLDEDFDFENDQSEQKSQSSAEVIKTLKEKLSSHRSAKTLFKLLCYDSPNALWGAVQSFQPETAVYLFEVMFSDFIESVAAETELSDMVAACAKKNNVDAEESEDGFSEKVKSLVQKGTFFCFQLSLEKSSRSIIFSQKQSDYKRRSLELSSMMSSKSSSSPSSPPPPAFGATDSSTSKSSDFIRCKQDLCYHVLSTQCHAVHHFSRSTQGYRTTSNDPYLENLIDQQRQFLTCSWMSDLIELSKPKYKTQNVRTDDDQKDEEQFFKKMKLEIISRIIASIPKIVAKKYSKPGEEIDYQIRLFTDILIGTILRTAIVKSEFEIITFLLYECPQLQQQTNNNNNDDNSSGDIKSVSSLVHAAVFKSGGIQPFSNQGFAKNSHGTLTFAFSDDYLSALAQSHTAHVGSGPTSSVQRSINGFIPLFHFLVIAVEKGNLDIVKMLVQKGEEDRRSTTTEASLSSSSSSPTPSTVVNVWGTQVLQSIPRTIIKLSVVASVIYNRWEIFQFLTSKFSPKDYLGDENNNSTDDEYDRRQNNCLLKLKLWKPVNLDQFNFSGGQIPVSQIDTIFDFALRANKADLTANNDMLSSAPSFDDDNSSLSVFIEDKIPNLLKIFRTLVKDFGLDPNISAKEATENKFKDVPCCDCTETTSKKARDNILTRLKGYHDPLSAANVFAWPLLHRAVNERLSVEVIRFMVEVLGCDPTLGAHGVVPLKKEPVKPIEMAETELMLLRQKKESDEYKRVAAVRYYLLGFEEKQGRTIAELRNRVMMK